MAEATKPGGTLVIDPYADGHCFAVIPYRRTEGEIEVTGAMVNIRLQPGATSAGIQPLVGSYDTNAVLTQQEQDQFAAIMFKLGIMLSDSNGYIYNP
jgi:hypothetical protein